MARTTDAHTIRPLSVGSTQSGYGSSAVCMHDARRAADQPADAASQIETTSNQSRALQSERKPSWKRQRGNKVRKTDRAWHGSHGSGSIPDLIIVNVCSGGSSLVSFGCRCRLSSSQPTPSQRTSSQPTSTQPTTSQPNPTPAEGPFREVVVPGSKGHRAAWARASLFIRTESTESSSTDQTIVVVCRVSSVVSLLRITSLRHPAERPPLDLSSP